MPLNAAQRALGTRLGAYGLVALLSIVTSGIILRSLGVSRAGSYFSATAVALVAFSISDQNLASVALRDASKKSLPPAQVQARIRSILGFRVASWTLACCLVAVLLNTPLRLAHVVESAVTIYLWILLLIVTGVMQIPAQSAMRQGRSSVLLVLQSLISLATAAGLSQFSAPTWTYFGVQIPGLLCAGLILASDPEARALALPSMNLRDAGSLARTNVLLGAATACAVISNRLSAPLILGFGGARAAGEYGAAFRLTDAIESIAPLLMTVLLPALTRSVERHGNDLADQLVSLSYRMLPLGILLGGFLGIWGAASLRVIGGDQFDGLSRVFQWLGVFILLAFIVQPINYVLLATSRYRALLAASGGAAVTLLVATAALTGSYGAAGAAAATATSFAVLGAVSAYAVRDLLMASVWRRYLLVAVALVLSEVAILITCTRFVATAAIGVAMIVSHGLGGRPGRRASLT